MKASCQGMPRLGRTKNSGQKYSAGNWFAPAPDQNKMEALKAKLEEMRGQKTREVKTHSEARVLTDMGWKIRAYGQDYVLLTMRG